MQKQFLIFFFLLLAGSIAGQNPFIEIAGRALNNNTQKPVAGIYVELYCNDSIRFRIRSDSNGHYSFFVSRKSVGKKIQLTAWYDMQEHKRLARRDTVCGDLVDGFYGYLTAYANLPADSIKNNRIEKDFFVKPVVACWRFPELIFEKNSTRPTNNMAELEQFMACFLKKNPNIIVELNAHSSSNEKNKQQLSENRAAFIMEQLVKSGINPRRIKTKGWGDQQQLIKSKVIHYAKTAEEKEALQALNRRLDFRILSWDFKE